MNKKERTISFLWQHLWLLVSLFIMTLGVAVCVKSELGSSVISTLPYVFETAGKRGLGVPSLTIGQYTYIMNAILVAGQIAVLRRRFEPVQLFQLLVGFVFGSLIDLNMALTSWLLPDGITEQALAQIAGCTVAGGSRRGFLLCVFRSMAMVYRWCGHTVRYALCGNRCENSRQAYGLV